MVFDIDAAVKQLDAVLPWDFEVRIADHDYETTRPSVAQVGQLGRLGQLGADEGAALLRSLFADERPPDEVMTIERTTILLQAYMAYLTQRLAKNSPAVAAQVRAATATT